MKDGMRQYAFKSRKIQESYLRKHSDGGAGRKAREAGRCHRIQQSRESKKEEVNAAVELYGKFVQLTEQVYPNVPFSEEEQLALDIYTNALKETATILKEKQDGESEVGIGEPVQSSRKKRSKVGSGESSSSGRRRRNEKVRESKDGEDGASRKEES